MFFGVFLIVEFVFVFFVVDVFFGIGLCYVFEEFVFGIDFVDGIGGGGDVGVDVVCGFVVEL